MAIAYEQLVKIILLLVVTIFIGVGFLVFAISGADAAERASCQTSLALVLSTTFGGVVSPFEFSCPRRVITIGEDTMQHTQYEFTDRLNRPREYAYSVAEQTTADDGSPRLRIVSGKSVTRDEESLSPVLKDVFSHELTECWRMFDEGNIDILRQDSGFRESNVCLICAEIFLDRNFEPFPIKLSDHFKTTYAPLHTGQARTLDEYLFHDNQPMTPRTCMDSFPSFDNLLIQPYQSYAVVFFRTGRVFRGLNDNDVPCQGIGVLPTQQISTQCDSIIN